MSEGPKFDRDGFRLRGTEGSRIDAFSDVVFGFALTLLVVSLEVPKTYAELHEALKGFFPFALCFLFLILLWLEHYRFFRRFGLEDPVTIWINALLLFVVLFYVYPLKFLFTIALGGSAGAITSPGQMRGLMVLYGAGFCAVYGLIALLYVQGWRQRRELELTPREEELTRSHIASECMVGMVGLLSAAVACVLPSGRTGDAGWVYLLIALCVPLERRRLERRLRRLDAAAADEAAKANGVGA